MFRVVLIYLVLFTAAIPWYWPVDEVRLLFGLPIWVSVSVLISIVIALFTAYLLIKYPWPGEGQE